MDGEKGALQLVSVEENQLSSSRYFPIERKQALQGPVLERIRISLSSAGYPPNKATLPLNALPLDEKPTSAGYMSDPSLERPARSPFEMTTGETEMNIVTLSDHTAKQAGQASARRDAEFKEACLRYNALLVVRVQEAARLSTLRRAAWGDHRYFLWLLRWIPCIAHELTKRPKHPVPTEAGRDEIIWNIGRKGEQKVLSHLSQQLDESWTLICGYRNAKGEVDQLLVGPAGIVAIEIKYLNGHVSCDGDRWWRDKYDSYHNMVEKAIPIADKRGRGPSRQVNDVVDLLECRLRKHSKGLPRILRAVVLSHDKSELRVIRNPTVDIISTLDCWDLGGLRKTPVFSADRVQSIVDTICREHQSFESSVRRTTPAAGFKERI